MRIVVNDIAASEGGAMSVLKDFYEEVKEFGSEHEWIFLLGDNYLKETSNIKILVYPEVKKSWLNRIMFEFKNGATIINKLNPGIYLSLQNTATLGIDAKQVVYFHQVIPYQTTVKFSLLKKDEVILWVYKNVGKFIYDLLFKKTDTNIIVQSNWLKTRMEKKLNNTIKVSKPKINHLNMKNLSILESNSKPHQFFYPSSNKTYKNLEIIFSAVRILQRRNVTNFKMIITVDKDIYNDMENIEFIGSIKREDVYYYLTTSTLVFPSLLESFGLPLLEGMAVGTYILAADLEYARETLENYNNVQFFSIEDSKILADYMEDMILGKTKYLKNDTKDVQNKKIIDLLLEECDE